MNGNIESKNFLGLSVARALETLIFHKRYLLQKSNILSTTTKSGDEPGKFENAQKVLLQNAQNCLNIQKKLSLILIYNEWLKKNWFLRLFKYHNKGLAKQTG